MFIPWWGIGLLGAILIYLVAMDIRLHRRVKRLESTVRRLEGISEEDLKKEIRERMFRSMNGGN